MTQKNSEKALVTALAQMYVQGVSTRKVAAITQELCGHEFRASSISGITARLDEQLEQSSRRRLEEAFPYPVMDARYERVREGGVIVSRAILIALGIDWEGRRQVLAVEYANRESQSSWREFLLLLKAWLEKWGAKYAKLCAWVETNIEETWMFYRLPVSHHKHFKSTNLLERFNQEIKRRTLVVRIFPDEASRLRLMRAVAAEQHEEWLEGSRHVNVEPLREQAQPVRKELSRAA
jgi:putative transposase